MDRDRAAVDRTTPSTFPSASVRSKIYLMYHEEMESLVKHIPALKRIRFWMTFSDNYLNHLRGAGERGHDPDRAGGIYEGQEVVPLQFLKALLPDPATWARAPRARPASAASSEGIKDGKPRKDRLRLQHLRPRGVLPEVESQAISYTTGVPAMIGGQDDAHREVARRKGVFNMEQFDPDPFMEELNQYGLPWEAQTLNHPLE